MGAGVTGAQPGDAVYANLLDTGFGGFAEYVAVPVDVLAPAPATLSIEEAAAIPMAAVTALQGLRYHGEIRPGQAVLVNGASGGVGHFGVQIAKAAGAVVTGVTSTSNLDLVRSLGADHVIDYTTEDFTKTGRTYDLVLDTIGNRSVGDLRGALAATGKAAVTGFTSLGLHLARAVRGGKRIKTVGAHVTSRDLDRLNALVAAGDLRPRIDRRYPFAEIPEAVRYLEGGHARGKVVVTVATT